MDRASRRHSGSSRLIHPQMWHTAVAYCCSGKRKVYLVDRRDRLRAERFDCRFATANPSRLQAESPLIALSKFAKPAPLKLRNDDALTLIPKSGLGVTAAGQPERHSSISARTVVNSCGAQVAQLVEHVTENHGVGGSIPPLGTISLFKDIRKAPNINVLSLIFMNLAS